MEYRGRIPKDVEDGKSISMGAEAESSINCALCNTPIKSREIRFLLSSAELLKLDLPIKERQVCVSCYSSTRSIAAKRNRPVAENRKYSEQYANIDIE